MGRNEAKAQVTPQIEEKGCKPEAYPAIHDYGLRMEDAVVGFSLLTFAVSVTYAQSLFNAVPLILATGPQGSGKIVLGRAMTVVYANSCVLGAASVAAMARQIDKTHGLVVFDDIESLATRKNEPRIRAIFSLGSDIKARLQPQVWL